MRETAPMPLLTDNERIEFLEHHSKWEIKEQTLKRTFEFKDFVAAMGFVTQVAILAEKAFHHPDIDIRWNKVAIALSTHDEGGLTLKDTSLAASIEALVIS